MAISTPTTLILGAGSSVHCGFPLGIPLIADIAKMRNPTSGLVLPSGWQQNDVNTFIIRLSRSAHYSIDAFLETAPESIDIGKYLIAAILKKLENIDRLFPPNNSGWYQYLFNCIVDDTTQSFDGNQLSVVTFNYERSLESYLFYAIKARFNFDDTRALNELNKIQIIHVHGSLGLFPQVPYMPINNADELREVSKSIQVISEIQDLKDSFCNDEFKKAHDAINKSKKIVFLGFGFHKDNVRRLRVDWSQFTDRDIRATFTGATQESYNNIIERLAPFGISKDILPLSSGHECNDFFQNNISARLK